VIGLARPMLESRRTVLDGRRQSAVVSLASG
jgi:hypothetical protein